MSNAQEFDFENARELMVEAQVRTWEVLDPAVLDAMRNVAREDFVPQRFHNLAYADSNIPLAHGEVMLQPKVEGRLLQSLDLSKNDRVLEVGTGSGYLTALLAQLADSVRSIDIHEDFTAEARDNLKGLDLDNVTLESGDASKLDDIGEQFDAIVVTGSMPELHDSFRKALKVGGRLFVIIGRDPIMEAQLHTRVSENDWAEASLFDTKVPALVNAWNPQRFTL
ncbi:MAG: protein-L-isoaspartate O-methyltransferase [Gammaproteobacteria bacterium]|nr:protein-L-isoaspartate O-methyltransferase [Gammaproteobacteria bacterium]